MRLADLAAMRASMAAMLDTISLALEVRMFGEERPMPNDRPYGEFWLIGGSGFVVDEKAFPPIIRRVGLLQLTIRRPCAGTSVPCRRMVAAFNRGFAGRSLCDMLGRSYRFERKGDVAEVAAGGSLATVGRIGFIRDEEALEGDGLDATW